jgi:hypothetical protein
MRRIFSPDRNDSIWEGMEGNAVVNQDADSADKEK